METADGVDHRWRHRLRPWCIGHGNSEHFQPTGIRLLSCQLAISRIDDIGRGGNRDGCASIGRISAAFKSLGVDPSTEIWCARHPTMSGVRHNHRRPYGWSVIRKPKFHRRSFTNTFSYADLTRSAFLPVCDMETMYSNRGSRPFLRIR